MARYCRADQNKGQHNPNLSILVSRFCSTNLDLVSAETFLKLTSEASLPVISVESAVPLMVLEQTLLQPSKVAMLSSLQDRCIENLTATSSWQFLDSPCFQKSLANLSPLVLSKVLAKSVGRAKCNLVQAGGKVVPKKIVAEGAGSAAVNRLYVRTKSLYEGFPRFAKTGTWEGQPVQWRH